MSGEQSSDVLERLLHSGHRRQQPTDTFNQPASTNWLYRAVGELHSAIVLSLLQVVWNSLPTEFRDLSVGLDVFRHTLKLRRYYSRDISASGAVEMYALLILRYINFRYLSIYLSIYQSILVVSSLRMTQFAECVFADCCCNLWTT